MSPDGVYGKEEWQSDPAAATAEALRRIDHVCESGETWLYFSDLFALAALPPELERCGHIERLDVGGAKAPDGEIYGPFRLRVLVGWPNLAFLKALRFLKLTYTNIADLGPLANLTKLVFLDCYGTQIRDLAPLGGLTKLGSLHIGGGDVSDLTGFPSLPTLWSLDCSDSDIEDLSPISQLTGLTNLNCSGTKVSRLSTIRQLTSLDDFNFSGTLVDDLVPLLSLPGFVDGKNAMWLSFGDTPLTKDGRWAEIAGLGDGHERTRRAVILLRKLANARVAEHQQKAAVAGGLDPVLRSGKVGFTQRPEEEPKPIDIDPALRAVLDEQAARARMAVRHIERSEKNFDKGFLLPQIADYLAALIDEDPELLDLRMAMEVLGPNTADDFLRQTLDAGTLNILDQLVGRHPDVIAAVDKAPEAAPALVIDEEEFDGDYAEDAAIEFVALVESDAGHEAIDPDARRTVGKILSAIQLSRKERAEESDARIKMRGAMLRRNFARLYHVASALSIASTLSGFSAVEAWSLLAPKLDQFLLEISMLFTK
jgi:hypothetical protein